MSAKRDPDPSTLPIEEHGDAASSGNKRIKANPAFGGQKRATRASTGTPIVLTTKGSLYRAHKDTGTSSEDSDADVLHRKHPHTSTAAATVAGGPAENAYGSAPTGGAASATIPAKQEQRCDNAFRELANDNLSGGMDEKRHSPEYDDLGHGNEKPRTVESGSTSNGGETAVGGAGINGRDEAGGLAAVLQSPTDEPAPSAPRRRRGRKGRSIYRGVCVTREGKWRAVIYKERKQLYLGVYESELEAAKAHDRAARFHFPDKAMTNFNSEEDADRLMESEEQQRRVQQDVDRDLAPLRRLGAMAAASRVGSKGGYAGNSRGRMSSGCPRAGAQGGTMVHSYGNVQDESGDDGDVGGGGESGVVGSGDGRSEVEGSQHVREVWGNETNGAYRTPRGPHADDYGDVSYPHSRSGGVGPGYPIGPVIGGTGRLGRRLPSSHLSSIEAPFAWRHSDGINGRADESGAYDDNNGYNGYHGGDDGDEDEGTGSSAGGVGRPPRSMFQGHDSLPGIRAPGAGSPRALDSEGGMPGERSRGSSSGGMNNSESWRGVPNTMRPRRTEGGEWRVTYDDNTGLSVADGERNHYWGGQRGSRTGSGGGTEHRRSEAAQAAPKSKCLTDDKYIQSDRQEWIEQHYPSTRPVPGAGRGAAHVRHRADDIAMIEAKAARTTLEDKETMDAAEAAMAMAGYSRTWNGRGVTRTNRGGGLGGGDGEEDDAGFDSSRGLERYPRYRSRSDVSMRAREDVDATRWHGEGRVDFEDAQEQAGGGGGVDPWRRSGSYGMHRGDDGGNTVASTRERMWRASGGYHESGYPESVGGRDSAQGRSRSWDVSVHNSEDKRYDGDGGGTYHHIRTGFPQHRRGGIMDVEPVTVAAAAAAVALKHGTRKMSYGGSGGLGGRPTERTAELSQRWLGALGHGGNANNVSTSEGFYTSSRPVTYNRESRTTHNWTELGAAAAAAAAAHAAVTVASPRVGPRGDRFSPSYYDHYEDPRLPPGTAVHPISGGETSGDLLPMRKARRVSTATSTIDREYEFGLRERERERPQGRTRRTPHDVYQSGRPGFDHSDAADSPRNVGESGRDRREHGQSGHHERERIQEQVEDRGANGTRSPRDRATLRDERHGDRTHHDVAAGTREAEHGASSKAGEATLAHSNGNANNLARKEGTVAKSAGAARIMSEDERAGGDATVDHQSARRQSPDADGREAANRSATNGATATGDGASRVDSDDTRVRSVNEKDMIDERISQDTADSRQYRDEGADRNDSRAAVNTRAVSDRGTGFDGGRLSRERDTSKSDGKGTAGSPLGAATGTSNNQA